MHGGALTTGKNLDLIRSWKAVLVPVMTGVFVKKPTVHTVLISEQPWDLVNRVRLNSLLNQHFKKAPSEEYFSDVNFNPKEKACAVHTDAQIGEIKQIKAPTADAFASDAVPHALLARGDKHWYLFVLDKVQCQTAVRRAVKALNKHEKIWDDHTYGIVIAFNSEYPSEQEIHSKLDQFKAEMTKQKGCTGN